MGTWNCKVCGKESNRFTCLGCQAKLVASSSKPKRDPSDPYGTLGGRARPKRVERVEKVRFCSTCNSVVTEEEHSH